MKRVNRGRAASWVLAGVAALLGAASAHAQINPPPWWGHQDPNASQFCFEFDTNAFPFVPNPDLWAPFGDPDYAHNNLYWTDHVTTSDDGDIGVVKGQSATVDFRFRNALRPNWVKEVWMQYDWYAMAGSSVSAFADTSAGSQIENAQTLTQGLGGNWNRTTTRFNIRPQPEWERIRFEFVGNGSGNSVIGGAWMDNFCFGTICRPVPEPAEIATLGVGVVALLRRRKK